MTNSENLVDTATRYKMVRSFKVQRADRAANKEVKVGDTVYSCMKSDYGLASDDTETTGMLHLSVTFKSDGDYPCFTIPFQDLRNDQD